MKEEIVEITIFPVLFALGEIKENITVTTNVPFKPSKEQIINPDFSNIFLLDSVKKLQLFKLNDSF